MISYPKAIPGGKFYDFSAKGNALDWHKNTFVLAPNAYGKSTLVNVLRSLCYNDPKLIHARKPLGAVAQSEAVIVIDGENHVFNGTQRNRPFSSIQIFDVPFIHSNILAHEIGHEHKKNIHKIIIGIGAKGIKLAEELAALKTKEKAKSREVAGLVGQFKKGGFTLSQDAFLAILSTEEAAVDQHIQKLEQNIKSKETEVVVRGLSFLNTLSVVDYKPMKIEPSIAETLIKDEPAVAIDNLVTLKILAGQKLANVQESTEKQVFYHIERNFKDKTQAKPFIRQGIDVVQADCPFCGQDLKDTSCTLNRIISKNRSRLKVFGIVDLSFFFFPILASKVLIT